MAAETPGGKCMTEIIWPQAPGYAGFIFRIVKRLSKMCDRTAAIMNYQLGESALYIRFIPYFKYIDKRLMKWDRPGPRPTLSGGSDIKRFGFKIDVVPSD